MYGPGAEVGSSLGMFELGLGGHGLGFESGLGGYGLGFEFMV